MNKIEAAKQIIKNYEESNGEFFCGRPVEVSCGNCPAYGKGICRADWKGNYCKYQPIEKKRGCETCRFSHKNNADYMSHCPGISCGSLNNFKDYQPLQKEKTKMKKVVLELPNQEVYITMSWLEVRGACTVGKKWFESKFGKDFKLNYKFVDEYCCGNNKKDYAAWILNRIPQQVEGEFVHIDDVNITKHYAMNFGGNIFISRHSPDRKYYFSCVNNMDNWFDGDSSLKKDITTHLVLRRTIYQFDSFDDFVDEYKKGNIK